MILKKGEKIHVIHRRHFEKDPHRHFVGIVDDYESGVARVTGHVYTVDSSKFAFVRRQEVRVRLISIVSGDMLVNIIPATVNLEKIVYQQQKKGVRVTDGSDWHIEIGEYAWM
ncbi:MAG: hypothetical protein EXS31_01790 [Pedosphaera sp.]|nr:hypothetical protein [Pedosphaera sp.]